MLMVLLVLAILTGIAVQSLQPLAQQAAYESSRQTLLRIDEAVLGPQGLRQADGTPVISGFAADVGRLPLPVPGSLPGSELIELWHGNLWTSFPYATRSGPVEFDDEDFSQIRLPCGWRGPYLQPASSDGLRDGWGKPLLTVWTDPPSPAATAAAGLIVTADTSFELPEVEPVPQVLPLVSLLVNVHYEDGEPVKTEGDLSVTVYLVHPDPALPSSLAVVPFAETDGNFSLHAISPGLRAVRVIVKQGGATIPNGDKTVYRHLLRQGLSDVQLTLSTPKPAPLPDPED